MLSNNAPWQPHYLGIGGKLGPGIDPPASPRSATTTSSGAWRMSSRSSSACGTTSKPGDVVGALWPDDPDGNAWSDPNVGFPPAFEEAGFTLVDPGRFPLGWRDSRPRSTQFKEAGVEIVTGVHDPPDFGNFWAQAQQQGFKPEAVTLGKCCCSQAPWLRTRTRSGCRRRSGGPTSTRPRPASPGRRRPSSPDAYEAAENKQWTQPIGYVHSLFEVLVDAIVRAGGAEDKQALLDAMGETNLDTIAGKVDFTKPVVPHITKTPLVGGQWVEGEKWDVEFKIVTNEQFPEIPLDGTLEAIG